MDFIACCGAFLIMKEFLKNHLESISEFNKDWTVWDYAEDVNPDALSDDWLENRTSYIYKVGVLTAIDANKCDWVEVVIGCQRSENSDIEIKGVLNFQDGENDDIGRVLERTINLLKTIHPVFDAD